MANSSTSVGLSGRGQAAPVKEPPKEPPKERGTVLFMSLVILLVITVLGLSSLQTTFMQEYMARNSYDNNLAFQAAEAAIKDAELYISNSITSLDPFTAASANADGFYTETEQASPLAPNWRSVDWHAATGGYRTAPSIAAIAEPPKYIIEFIRVLLSADDRLNLDNIGQNTSGYSGCAYVFRVTAYATGATRNERVIMQSTYGKCF